MTTLMAFFALLVVGSKGPSPPVRYRIVRGKPLTRISCGFTMADGGTSLAMNVQSEVGREGNGGGREGGQMIVRVCEEGIWVRDGQ